MSIFNKIKQVIKNKVLIYLFSRYFTYFIQFITSILIAIKLGPYNFGIWGFLLLLINYFQITNFGVSNSINVLMVQNKRDEVQVKNIVSTSLFLIGIICCGVILIAIYYYYFNISYFDKFEVGNLFYAVCFIAILAYYNYLFVAIYRVKNSLFEIAFFQSIIPLLVFISLFLAKNRALLILLLAMYIIGHVFAFIIFIKGEKLPRGGKVIYKDIILILKKGGYLFIYNISFYLIIISVRTIISAYYKVEEFGLFTFSYTLANSFVLFIEAMAFVIFPKIIDKLNSDSHKEVENTIKAIRINYVSLTHGMLYIALVAFPIFVSFLPQYNKTTLVFNLIVLTIILYTNSFGYNSYLLAINKEKIIAKISFSILILNISMALVLVKIFMITYEYVIISTLLSYFIYAYICVYFGRKNLNQNTSSIAIMRDLFPINLLIPYLAAIALVILKKESLLIIPFISFLILNQKTIQEIYKTLKRLIHKPNIINI